METKYYLFEHPHRSESFIVSCEEDFVSYRAQKLNDAGWKPYPEMLVGLNPIIWDDVAVMFNSFGYLIEEMPEEEAITLLFTVG